jgi:hypothetical protein
MKDGGAGRRSLAHVQADTETADTRARRLFLAAGSEAVDACNLAEPMRDGLTMA